MTEEMLNDEDLWRRLEALRLGTLPEDALYATIHAFGRQQLLAAREEVERLLTHEDPQVRYIALEVLILHWRLVDHRETACAMLNYDPDVNNRCLAASCLGALMRDTSDANTLRALAFVVSHEQEERSVQLSAYQAMRAVLHYDAREQWEMTTHATRTWRQIDWTLVRAPR